MPPTDTTPSDPRFDDLQIVVASCDKNFDLWDLFFDQLSFYWRQAPLPVCLITNHLTLDRNGVESLHAGARNAWTDSIHFSLGNRVNRPYTILLLDDFILSRQVDVKSLASFFSTFKEIGADYLSLCAWGLEGELSAGRFRSSVGPHHRANLNDTLWKTDYLHSFCGDFPDMSIWKAESEFRKRATLTSDRLFYLNDGEPKVFEYEEGVKGGLWKGDSVPAIHRMGGQPQLFLRPSAPLTKSFAARLTRSLFKFWRKIITALALGYFRFAKGNRVASKFRP